MECNQRLETLYKKHHKWLISCGVNISKSEDKAEELVNELYLYLAEKCNAKLWYKDSYNLQYCRMFLNSRFINEAKRGNRKGELLEKHEGIADTEYDTEWDAKLEGAYNEVKEELNNMKRRQGWASAMIFEEYWFGDDTLEEVSKKIGISKSTTFLNVKKVRNELKDKLKNPFN